MSPPAPMKPDVDTPRIVGIGELLWDCFGDTRRPGGAPANVVFHATQLGAAGVLCTCVGRDEAGDALVAYLKDRGVDTAGVQRDEQHETGRVTVDASDPNHPCYVIHEDVAWDHIRCDARLEHLAADASAVCFGTLAQRSPTSRASIHRCLEAAKDAMIVYDINLRPPWFTPDVLAASLHRCDVVKLNEHEVVELAEMFAWPSKTMGDVADRLMQEYAISTVCITCGADGCFLQSSSQKVRVPGKPVDVADAVGAGDAFTAALVCGLLWRWPVGNVAGFANEVGGLVATRSGAMPPLSDAYRTLIAATKPSEP